MTTRTPAGASGAAAGAGRRRASEPGVQPAARAASPVTSVRGTGPRPRSSSQRRPITTNSASTMIRRLILTGRRAGRGT